MRRLCAVAAMVVATQVLTGCSDSGVFDEARLATGISGTAVKGPIAGARVQAFYFDETDTTGSNRGEFRAVTQGRYINPIITCQFQDCHPFLAGERLTVYRNSNIAHDVRHITPLNPRCQVQGNRKA